MRGREAGAGGLDLDEAAGLRDARARRAWLARRPDLVGEAAVRELERAVIERASREPQGALALADLATLVARRVGGEAVLVARMSRARALFRCARYREADALLADLAAERESRREPREAGLAHLARLGPLTNLGEMETALRAAARARKCLGSRADAVDRAKLEGNRGMILHRLGRLREALACFRRARPAFVRRGDALSAAIIDLNRGQAHSQLGESPRAGALFDAARRTFESLGQAVLIASVDYNRACDHVTGGRYDLAWTALESVRRDFERLGDTDAIARADLDLAEIAWRLGSPEVAGERAARAREGFEKLGARLDAARARCVEALTLARTGAVAPAREALRSAAAAFPAEGHDVPAAAARLDLATLLVADEPIRAARLARHAGAVLARAGHRDAAVRATLVEALAHAHRGSPRAEALLRRVATLARRREAPDVLWQAQSALAGLHLAAGRIGPARRCVDEAADVIDRMRNELRRLEPARWVLRDGAGVYEQAVAAWTLGATSARTSERAFLHAERARSRALADSLALGGAAPRQPLQLQRGLDLNDDARRQAPASRSGTRSSAFGGWSSLTGSEEASVAARSGALRSALRGHERLLEFQRVGDELRVFVLTREGVTQHGLGACASEVDDLLLRLGFHLGKFALGADHVGRFMPLLRRQADALLDGLGRLLLRPVSAHLRGRLIVVPTRELHLAPFPALRLDGRYLVETSTTSLVPSCVVLALLRRRRRRGDGALVVGVGGAALPQVEREAREVAALLPGSRLLLGDAADRASFRQGVAGRAIVHVATHGTFRPERPTLSSLQLADGPLTLQDVYELPLCADLVTLTACESGRSRVGPGDDLTGLARGFLHAGARRVLVSLWGLDDAQARHVMHGVYRRLPAAPPAGAVASALREAVLDVLPTAPHPFYWATFALVGAP